MSMNRYLVAVEHCHVNKCYGVVVPDLPGCFSGCDDLGEVIENTLEAVSLWLEECVAEGWPLPEPKPMDVHQENREFEGWLWYVLTVNESVVESTSRVFSLAMHPYTSD